MPQANKYEFVVTQKSSYGDRGDLVELESDELTDRQKLMLKPYKKPQAKKLVNNDKKEDSNKSSKKSNTSK